MNVLKDLYEILGIERTAFQEEIKRKYRLFAKKYHPDLNQGDEKSERIFKKINLITDQRGGDVDTILTVRDKEIGFKNAKYETAYQNRGDYNSNQVHSDSSYRAKNKEVSEAKKGGNLRDAYTGEKLSPNAHVDLDHVVSAKEVHDDRGRVLAGLDTADIANIPANLQPTERSINRSKKAKSAQEA